jgi:cytoskeletal protein CcmA (bactofilin family)
MRRSITLALLCLVAGLAAADDERRSVGADVFIGGDTVTVDDAVGGDLFAAGGTVDVDAAVGGDAVAAGGKLRLGADVGQSVYAAGGQVNVNGRVGRNLRVAGGRVELGPKADVAGNVSMAGGRVQLHGAVHGHVQAAGGRVLINGPVGGDVWATSGEVVLGPQARIAGKLRYRSGEALQQDPAAQVSGGIELLMPRWGGASEASDASARGIGWLGWLWTAGLVVLAALWLALAPQASARSSQALRERPAASVALGFVWLVCVPVLSLLLLLTIIGIPLALFALALYVAVLPLAYVAAAAGLGDWVLHRWRAASADAPGWRTAAAALVLVLLMALGRVAWLGTLVASLLLLAGLGALMLAWRRPRPPLAA